MLRGRWFSRAWVQILSWSSFGRRGKRWKMGGGGDFVDVGESEVVDVSAPGEGFGCSAFLSVIVMLKCQLRLLVL